MTRAWAADLAKVDRTIAKEPIYREQPQYALLVFGRETRTRAWLVLDGDTLYVDRDGNGDLTEPGERLTATLVQRDKQPSLAKCTYHFVDLRQPGMKCWTDADRDVPMLKGTERYRRLTAECTEPNKDFVPATAAQREQKDAFDRIWAGFADVYVRVGAKLVQRGRAKLADRPDRTPVIHFDGPMSLALADPAPTLTRGGKEAELRIRVFAPGLGDGAGTYLRDFTPVPADVHPIAEIEYPNR
jgi:hypothetical protein